jgi:hypothetical protein
MIAAVFFLVRLKGNCRGKRSLAANATLEVHF